MAFEKEVNFKIVGVETLECDDKAGLEKAASVAIPEEFVYDPDLLYLLVRIVSSGEYYGSNKNADYFPTSELLYGYRTFTTGNVFEEHRNKDVSQAIGKIISVEWNDKMKCVEVLKGIDRKIAPAIVRGYEKGYMTDVSMGCRVPYVECSICGNRASVRREYCDHVKFHRNKLLPTGERVFEINYKPKFHDSSVVLNGAERSAKAVMILGEEDFTNGVFEKSASTRTTVSNVLSRPEFEKIASHKKTLHPLFTKTASAEELNKLAALEKELTGKIINVVSNSNNYDGPVDKFISLLRFLGDGRLTESVEEIADKLCELAAITKTPQSHVFGAFVSIAEVLGIPLYPSEVGAIAKEMALGSNPVFDCDGELPATISNAITAIDSDARKMIQTFPKLSTPEGIHTMFEIAPLYGDALVDNPESFFREIENKTTAATVPAPEVMNGIGDMLMSIFDARSAKSPRLINKLTSFIGGGEVLNNPSKAVCKEIKILAAPSNVGEILHALAYENYEGMRDKLVHSAPASSFRFFKGDIPTQGKVSEIYLSPLGATVGLKKIASVEKKAVQLIKLASPVDTGDYNILNEIVLTNFANEYGLDDETMSNVALATLFELTNNIEEANEVKTAAGIPDTIIGEFTTYLLNHADEDLNAVAEELGEASVDEGFDTVNLSKEANSRYTLDDNLKNDLLLRKVNKYFK